MLARRTGASVSAKEVSEACGIPLPLLSKLLQKLGKTGFLSSEFGTNGGYRLAKEPQDISVLQVIRAIDGPIVLANCFTENPTCGHAFRCTVKRPLEKIHQGILRLLNSISIQDMLQDSEGETDNSLPGALITLSVLPRTRNTESSVRNTL